MGANVCQTKNCDPNGQREPANDKQCDQSIPHGNSGFCECTGGVKRQLADCSHGVLPSCAQVCEATQDVSITLPSGWKSGPSISPVTFSAAAGISPSGTIQLNFKRPGLFRLTLTVNGKVYTASALILDVGP